MDMFSKCFDKKGVFFQIYLKNARRARRAACLPFCFCHFSTMLPNFEGLVPGCIIQFVIQIATFGVDKAKTDLSKFVLTI